MKMLLATGVRARRCRLDMAGAPPRVISELQTMGQLFSIGSEILRKILDATDAMNRRVR